jgi:hypothetical protein
MQPNRIGRVLGIGARVAGVKLREQADRLGSPEAQEAAARVKAGAAQAARNFRAAQAGSGTAQAAAGSGTANAAAVAEAASAGTRRLARGAGRFGAAFLRPFAHATSLLWNQVAGIFFSLFAVFFIEHTWMLYRAAHWQDRHVLLYGGLALVFAWFAASTLWRVWRKQRRG